MDKQSPKLYRRIVTGHSTIKVFEQIYVWTMGSADEADPATVDAACSQSRL